MKCSLFFAALLPASLALLAGCSSDPAPAAPTDTGSATDTAVADTGTVTDTGTPADWAGGDGGSDTVADVPPPTKVDCATYCDRVTANCTGVNAQYSTKPQCLNICAKLTVGALDDKTGDTMGCRQHFAVEAAADPTGNCRKAGMTGGLTCGTDRCASFCAIAFANCGTAAVKPFASEAECKTACAAMTFNGTAGEIEQVKGTLNCVQYHLEASYETTDGTSRDFHCPHLTLASGPCKP